MDNWRKRYAEKRRMRVRNGGCWGCAFGRHAERKTYCQSCIDKNKVFWASRKYYLRLKREVLDVYSYGEAKCACCGEVEYAFLSLDHIHGGGTQHRKFLGGSHAIYYDLRRRGFPSGYQVLCMNCNFAKGKLGHCPHQPTSEHAQAGCGIKLEVQRS